eukprot:TRINITY_DN555_c0_g1_i12.p1 TRINITY_DN555_c0_g1~~TRINITY_DN555_c0_g1_i12.p1  ORF type:complete len:683 (-),score=270.81 TRINITY_DN555_c0_g1_i12:138-2150(-)
MNSADSPVEIVPEHYEPAEQTARSPSAKAAALLFEDVSYSVDKRSLFSLPPLKKQRKTIIENCSGIVHQGELVAILGTSGAGKSTLLDVLAKRKTFGNIEGNILYNGKRIKSSHLPTNIAGYVRQDDYHLAPLTVRESMQFAADLRCRSSEKEKREKIDYLIKALSLSHAANSKVGDKMKRGISGGESRRLSIGMEMLNDPDLLFLDEPTSGLDSSSSKNVILLLRRLVRKRQNAAICTIHQPSREVFDYFDKVILLTKSESGVGTIAYFGPPMGVVPFFTRLGYPPRSARVNPADHMLQLCSIKRDPSMLMEDEEEERLLKKQRTALLLEGFPVEEEEAPKEQEKGHDQGSVKVQEFIDQYQKSPEKAEVLEDIDYCRDAPPSERDTTWRPLSFPAQTWILTCRAFACMAGSSDVVIGQAVVLFFLGIILSSGFWDLSYSQEDIQNRISLLFFLLLISQLVAQPLFGLFPRERILVNHERGAKLYGPLPYFISTSLSSVPLQVIMCLIFASVVYWCAGLRDDFTHYAIFIIEFAVMTTIVIYYALALGAFSPNVETALGLSAIFFSIMLLFNGFFLLESSIPPWWIWANWASPFKYAFIVCLINEFKGVTFPCEDGADCNFTTGNELLEFYNIDRTDLMWPYIAVSVGFALVFMILTYIFLRFRTHEKR